MKLIVGLGNPGSKYDGTRHNAGFALVDLLAAAHKTEFQSEKKFKGELACFSHPTHSKVFLLKPSTFMNLSGESVVAVCQFYKLQPSDVMILHDELDLPLNSMRFVKNGSPAGHNGLRSIIQHLGTQEFARLKIGIGRPIHPGHAVVDFVLQKFVGEEEARITAVYNRCLQGLSAFLDSGLDITMNRYNQKIK